MQNIYVRGVIASIFMAVLLSSKAAVSCPLEFSGCASRKGSISGEKGANNDTSALCATCMQHSITKSRPVEEVMEEHESDHISLVSNRE